MKNQKKIRRVLLTALTGLTVLAFGLAPFARAADGFIAQTQTTQTDDTSQQPAENQTEEELEPIIDSERNVGVGRKVVFDASKTINSYQNTTVQYEWDFGDGQRATGVDVTHAYDRTGDYRVTLTANNGVTVRSTETVVSVFKDLIVLITDNETTEDQVKNLERQAARQELLLVEISDRSSDPDFVVTETLTQELIARTPDIENADIIIDWTSGNLGLVTLSKYSQEIKDLAAIDFPHKAVVSVTEGSFSTIARTAQSTFNTLQPEVIVLTRPEALDAVIDARDSSRLLDSIRATGAEFQLIGVFSERHTELGPFNFMTFVVNFMVNEGVPLNTIFLILTLPVIATIIAFARQIIGIKTFGIFTPSILTLAFLATGLKYGLAVFLIILTVGTLSRIFLKRFRLFFLPRVAMVVTVVSLTILAIMGVGAILDVTGLVILSIFPVLIMAMLIEPIVNIQIERGSLAAVILTIETLGLSVAAYLIVSWEPFRTLFLGYPELILLTFVIHYLLGKWTGLRLTEYFRFREVRRFIKAGKRAEE